jgi:hypothetical protein
MSFQDPLLLLIEEGFLYMVRGASAFVGTPSAGATVRTSLIGSPKAYEGMALLVSALLVAATFSAAWVRVEAISVQDRGERKGWRL